MQTDYKALCLELFGTADKEELQAIAKSVRKKNSRNAGRKKAFSKLQIDEMKKMQANGNSQVQIAKQFHTTRQTVSKYLATDEDAFIGSFVQRIDYMCGTKVCTTIYVDYSNKRIKIINKTNDILHRAFGIQENPTWEDFEHFLEDRCFSRNRGDKKSILAALQVDSYDPMQIVRVTKGKTYDDRQWMRFKSRSMYETN